MRLALFGLLVTSVAYAQPVTRPAETQAHDEKLAEALAQITQDPAIHVDDPNARSLAQALMTEGVKQLQAQAYDQALSNFLAAYGQFPSPKILLDIASTLRDMGRLADAANTYTRYLADPATTATRVAEVKQLVIDLDKQLTILTVRVFPRGSEVSIDGGPFVAVGSSLQTRVRPGLHLVRVKHGTAASETTVNGFEGETKEVPVVLQDVVATDKPATPPTGPTPPKQDKLLIETSLPDNVDGWLITGTKYGAESGTSRTRHVRSGDAEVAPIVPKYETTDSGEVIVHYPGEDHISSGVLGVLRIDGHARGAAGGVGIVYVPMDHVEVEGAVLISNFWGGYLGARYRIFTGVVRPYVAAGMPMFFFTNDKGSVQPAPGIRAAAGVELKINGHLSVQGDLGYEHFFNLEGVVYNKMYTLDADLFVPTLGVIGRL
jgi:hypothetical protein